MSTNWRRSRVVLVLIVAGVPSAGVVWTAWPGERRDRLATARAVEAGRYDEAARRLKSWLAKDPGSPTAAYYGGRIALARGDMAAAVDGLARASQLGCPRAEFEILGALIQSKRGLNKEALPYLRKAVDVARRPDRQLEEALAKSYLETYDLVRAGQVLDRWMRDFPDDPKPYLWRAEIHSRSDESDLSVLAGDYREALARDPDLAGARLGLARALHQAHRNDDASAEYDAYLEQEPDDALAHLGAGRNLVESGRDDEAKVHLQRALALDPRNASVLGELAELAARRDDLQVALDYLDRAVELDPYATGLRIHRSLTLRRLGRIDDAEKDQDVLKRLRADLDALQRARQRLVQSPHDRAAQLEVTRWMFTHGQELEGVRWAEQILREDPGNPEASALLAEYHQRKGNVGLANYYRAGASSSKP